LNGKKKKVTVKKPKRVAKKTDVERFIAKDRILIGWCKKNQRLNIQVSRGHEKKRK